MEWMYWVVGCVSYGLVGLGVFAGKRVALKSFLVSFFVGLLWPFVALLRFGTLLTVEFKITLDDEKPVSER